MERDELIVRTERTGTMYLEQLGAAGCRCRVIEGMLMRRLYVM